MFIHRVWRLEAGSDWLIGCLRGQVGGFSQKPEPEEPDFLQVIVCLKDMVKVSGYKTQIQTVALKKVLSP